MAPATQKQIVMLEDDIQCGEATQTIRFSFDGVEMYRGAH